MALPTTLSTLLLVLALVPGWIYLRLVERLQPPSGTSGLHQVLEFLAVGVATTGVSAMTVALLPHSWLPFTLDLTTWAAKGSPYLRSHVRGAAGTLALVFGIAVLLAYGLYLVRARRKPKEFSNQGDVWIHGLGERPLGRHPYVGLQLDDGRLVEGPLHSYTFGAEPGKRDIALSGPIRVTEAGATAPQPLPNLDRLIIPESQIKAITVVHVPVKADSSR